jgi:hypothetical protein
MEPRITLVTLGVADLERAIRFYEHGLGLPRREPQLQGVAFFRMEGAWLSLFPREDLAHDATVASEGSGFRAFSLAHNVPDAADVDRVLAEAVAAGATLVKAAATASWGGRSGYFADPDGFLWEVAWNPHMTFD